MNFCTKALCVFILICMAPFAQAQDLPNVVMMVADNVGYGDIGGAFQGGEIRGMPTPRIESRTLRAPRRLGIDHCGGYAKYIGRRRDYHCRAV